MLLQIKEQKTADVTVLELKGRISLGDECRELEIRMTDLLNRGEKKVVLDLTGINLVDSAGVGTLVAVFGRMKKSGGAMRLVATPGKVQDVLSMTMVDKVLPVYPTVSAATENF